MDEMKMTISQSKMAAARGEDGAGRRGAQLREGGLSLAFPTPPHSFVPRRGATGAE